MSMLRLKNPFLPGQLSQPTNMATNITQTALPELINCDLQNTIDLHIATTNFNAILDVYINELALTYNYNQQKNKCDPISSTAEFFKNLNNDSLDLIDNVEGCRNPNITILTANNDINLNPGEIWKLDIGGNIEARLTNGIIELHAFNQLSNKDRWVPVEQNITDEVNNKLATLKNSYGQTQLSEEFLLYWIREFNKCQEQIKTAYRNLVPGSTDLFAKFSDSIGQITRIAENLESNTIPYFDKDLELYNEVPSAYTSLLNDKIDNDTKGHLYDFSKKVNILFRNNLYPLLDGIANSNTSHGVNLVGDYQHWFRMSTVIYDLNGIIAETIGDTIKVLYYLQSSNNEQKILPVVFEVVVEQSKEQLDLIKNNLQVLTKATKTVDIL